MKSYYWLILLSAFLISVTSCKKNKDTVTIVGKWKQVSGNYSPAFLGMTDYFSGSPSCEKDDLIEFKANNTYEVTEGTSKCDPTDPQVIDDGTYTVNASLTTLTILGQPLTISVSNHTLTVTRAFTDGGNNYTDISVHQRQ